ncbi:hypothetical protein LINPERPRIM_LOCUS9003 [Linum perenne]
MQGKVGVAEKENSDLGAESQRGVSKEGPDDSSLLSKDAGDWSGSNLCVICGKNGQLLVCGTDGCSSVVHESCLGSTPSFDSTGQFCCPYCADSIATSYYKKMKERMAVTLKHLSAFLSVGSENPSLEGTGRSDRNGNGKPDRFGDVGPFDENLGMKNEAGRLQHVTVAAHSINEKPTSEKDDAICNLRDSGEMQIERITVVCPSVRVPERKQDQDLPVPPCLGDSILGEKTDIVSEEQDLTEGVTKEKVPDKIFVHQVMPISAVPMGGGASDKGHNQPASSNNSVGSRKRERS